jgi:integrase
VDKRAIQREFKVLRRFFTWATKEVREDGTTWLPANHAFLTIGTPPKPAKRKRQAMSQPLYDALLAVAPQVSEDLRDLLELLHETGRRVGALLKLEFADANHAAGTLRWRRVFDKTGEESVVPASDRALALIRARAERLSVPVDAPLPVFSRAVRPLRLPTPPKQPSLRRSATWKARCDNLRAVHEQRVARARREPLRARTALDWLDKAFQVAEEARPEDRFAFHALRRKFAVDMRSAGIPDPVTRQIGGWRDEKTFHDVYADVTPDMQRAALSRRSRVTEEEAT